jgi:glucosamine--fructose-6-phosphate aminotransferase (isomerizing)
MCGIVGYIGEKPATAVLLDGLQKLEYRGYDSSGIAVLDHSHHLHISKRSGKIQNLVKSIHQFHWPQSCYIGIGHTRWATHGQPTDENAHPHLDCSGTIAVVHNGIIENYHELKQHLQKQGHIFKSQTDTEVLVHLLEAEARHNAWPQAVGEALKKVRGTYSLVILNQKDPHHLIGVRKGGGGLVIGMGKQAMFIASDVSALLGHTHQVFYLDDGEMIILEKQAYQVMDWETQKLRLKQLLTIEWTPQQAEKGGYAHFMLKEIMEQSKAMEDTLRGRIDAAGNTQLVELSKINLKFLKTFHRIVILACGTSYYAGLVGKFIFEDILKIPVEIDYASEFRYRDPVVDAHDLVLAISQSGETVDTLVAIREAKSKKSKTMAICNVLGSSITREADAVLLTRAGPEIGVASTKAFTTQVAAIWLLALELARLRRTPTVSRRLQMGRHLLKMPIYIEQTLQALRKTIKPLAQRFSRYDHFLYLGRGINYPIALEGALKLKEISYIHAEGYPAGEMKHGPIALIDSQFPVVVLALKSSRYYEKIISNIEQVRARSGPVIGILEKNDSLGQQKVNFFIEIPTIEESFSPMISILPLQLLAYEIAVILGREIDQPRNLAKSVTVE